ncbi:uncharacterized protein LOC127776929 [Oryza glaberrima]|uniref:uncharacterized protein LOC127776929 n=1 Tax=Oryza glaberrima TaxID=4538 RepID=UPI00224BECF5|nr:uncharacterized protein LOC127776929 [Oryza glaberrima]
MAKLPLTPSSHGSPIHDRFPRTPALAEKTGKQQSVIKKLATKKAVVTEMDMATVTVHKLFYSKGASDRQPQQASGVPASVQVAGLARGHLLPALRAAARPPRADASCPRSAPSPASRADAACHALRAAAAAAVAGLARGRLLHALRAAAAAAVAGLTRGRLLGALRAVAAAAVTGLACGRRLLPLQASRTAASSARSAPPRLPPASPSTTLCGGCFQLIL